jgi:hypothetical protein
MPTTLLGSDMNDQQTLCDEIDDLLSLPAPVEVSDRIEEEDVGKDKIDKVEIDSDRMDMDKGIDIIQDKPSTLLRWEQPL